MFMLFETDDPEPVSTERHIKCISGGSVLGVKAIQT